jgi:transcriptional regulator with GAF, ATPase, and Fis domain
VSESLIEVDLVLHRLSTDPQQMVCRYERLAPRPSATVCLLCAGEGEGLAARVAELSSRGKRVVCGLAFEASEELEWSLVDAGAVDCCRVGESHGKAALLARLEAEAELVNTLESPLVASNLVGRGPAWRECVARAVELARSDADVLLTGAPGTGKELIARLIHGVDRRRSAGPLVVLDCSTLVSELAGSEFFGHERGAFTGAAAARDGAFTQAHLGTLFLDEVGELPLALQAQLLRAVQERTFKKVGSNEWRRAEFRLVCATNRPLEKLVEHDSFRSDFFHRIASSRIHLPELAARREDIDALATHFASQLAGRPVTFAPALSRLLAERSYPGNVRELKQLVTRIWHRHVGPGPLSISDLPREDRAKSRAWHEGELEVAISRALAQHVPLRDIGRTATDFAIRLALCRFQSTPQAARELKVSERTLQLRRANQRRASGDDETEDDGRE